MFSLFFLFFPGLGVAGGGAGGGGVEVFAARVKCRFMSLIGLHLRCGLNRRSRLRV